MAELTAYSVTFFFFRERGIALFLAAQQNKWIAKQQEMLHKPSIMNHFVILFLMAELFYNCMYLSASFKIVLSKKYCTN